MVVFAPGAILVAIFYRYATERSVPPGFDRTVLDHAFVPERD